MSTSALSGRGSCALPAFGLSSFPIAQPHSFVAAQGKHGERRASRLLRAARHGRLAAARGDCKPVWRACPPRLHRRGGPANLAGPGPGAARAGAYGTDGPGLVHGACGGQLCAGRDRHGWPPRRDWCELPQRSTHVDSVYLAISRLRVTRDWRSTRNLYPNRLHSSCMLNRHVTLDMLGAPRAYTVALLSECGPVIVVSQQRRRGGTHGRMQTAQMRAWRGAQRTPKSSRSARRRRRRPTWR